MLKHYRAQQVLLSTNRRLILEAELLDLKQKYSDLHPLVRAKQQELDAFDAAAKKKHG